MRANYRFFEWVNRHARLVVAAVLLIALTLGVTASMVANTDEPSFEPSGEVFDLYARANSTLDSASTISSATFIFLAVALIVLLVAVVHRSYWSAVLVASGLGLTMQAPTLVLVRRDAVYHRAEHGRYLAAEIPHAELVGLPGGDTAPFFIGDTTPVLSAIEQFITGDRTHHVPDRTLATVMVTDIVDSTRLAAQLGDTRWLDTLDRHNRLTRQYMKRYHGKEINTTGDGFLATFDGPTRAITCAAHLQAAMPDVGVEIRVGLHTGEIEEDTSGDIGGLAVHIASRVTDATTEPGVVVSSTVKDLVTGSGIEFTPLGGFDLKGIPGTWNLHRTDALP